MSSGRVLGHYAIGGAARSNAVSASAACYGTTIGGGLMSDGRVSEYYAVGGAAGLLSPQVR